MEISVQTKGGGVPGKHTLKKKLGRRAGGREVPLGLLRFRSLKERVSGGERNLDGFRKKEKGILMDLQGKGGSAGNRTTP